MDSGANSDGSSDEMSIAARIRPSIRKAINHMEKYNKRRVTDTYWSGFFLIIITCWIVSCLYVTRHQSEYSILSDNITDARNASELFHLNNILPENNTATLNISEFLHQEVNNETASDNDCPVRKRRKEASWTEVFFTVVHMFLDVFTFNLSHLNIINEDSNLRPILHFMLSLAFLAFTFHPIYDNRTFCKQPLAIGATFFFVSMQEHLSAMFYAHNSIEFTLISSHEKIASWMIPEAIFIVLCLMRSFAGINPKKRGEGERPPFSMDYKFAVVVGIPVFAILHLLEFYTVSLLQKVVWGSAMFYVIVGGSCYIGLTIYYYGAMVISCAIKISQDRKRWLFTNIFRALLIVAQYHFGTACFHATLIFPRIRSTFVMNDKKLKALSECSTSKRFWMTHFDVHNSLTTFTGVFGTGYAKSLKELLRFWPNDVIKKDFHYCYKWLSIHLLISLLAINSIMILLLWMYDLDDPQFSLATRAMYAKIVLTFFLACPYLQATTDAHAFLAYRYWLRESADDILAEMMLGQYFDEFDSSDDDANSIDSGVYNESVF